MLMSQMALITEMYEKQDGIFMTENVRSDDEDEDSGDEMI